MADDWLNIALRFALYVDLTILFGVSLFGAYALRPDHRSSAMVEGSLIGGTVVDQGKYPLSTITQAPR